MARLLKRQRRPGIDLEEIAPNRFMIHTQRTQALLSDEGTITGRLFELTTWRREGLLARLRERGFRVRTLADMTAALPAPPPPPPIGGAGWRPPARAVQPLSR